MMSEWDGLSQKRNPGISVQRERQEEILSGRFVVLDDNEDAPVMRQAKAEMKREEQAEAAQEAAEERAVKQRAVDERQTGLVSPLTHYSYALQSSPFATHPAFVSRT